MRGLIAGLADAEDQLPLLAENIARGFLRGWQAATTPTATEAAPPPEAPGLEAEAVILAQAPVKE